MFKIDINPIALALGPLSLQWDTIWILVGIVVALVLFLVEGKRNGIPKKHIIRVYFLTIILALLCARLLYILENVISYNDTGELLTLKGIRIYGAIGGALLAIFIYGKYSHLPFLKFCDSGTIALIACFTILRIGCFMVGCCYGLPCNLPWSIQYSSSTIALTNIPIHPTQIYHLLAGGISVIASWFSRNIWKQPGTLSFFNLSLYSSGDLIVRFFRANEPIPSISFILGLVLLIISLVMFFLKIAKKC